MRPSQVSGPVHRMRLAALLLLSTGCARLGSPTPANNASSLDSSSVWPMERFDDGGQASLLRGHNLAMLHPTVRGLLSAHGAETAFIQHGVADLPLAACESAVSFRAAETHECSLVALADGKSAVLVISKSGECVDGDCMEHSWAFLDVYDVPFSLPARRASDYSALRQDLSREDASALWLAGFRGRSQGTRFAQLDPYAEPEIAGYQSCSVAPDKRELVCRSAQGDVIGLDAITAQQRLIARLGVEAAQQPVWWTAEGKLAAMAGVGEHPLCVERCPLVALLDWPSTGNAPRLVPAALAR